MNTKKPTKRFSVKKIGRLSGVIREYITTIDAEDAHYMRSSYWMILSGEGGTYVARNSAKHGHEFLHSILSGAAPGEMVWHINGDSLDNRKENLLKQSDRVQEVA